MRLRAAVSPCPNDTFIVHGIVSGAVSLPNADFDWTLGDVETLNRAALRGEYDITKLSFHAYLLVKDTYQLLRAGSALGFGCGPILVSNRLISPADISSLRIVLPGDLTTAHLLFRLFCPDAKNKRFVRYDEIISAIKSGEADAGVIIHEDRFVFEAAGLHRVQDLGEWWENETHCPIPLGCLAARRSIGGAFAGELDDLIRRSITAAEQNTPAAMPFILQHAKQTDPAIVRQHIDTFVTDFTKDLGEQGDRAVETLFRMAKAARIIP
jgi:1,4-dihydroxy-6-naphthoate synthase